MTRVTLGFCALIATTPALARQAASIPTPPGRPALAGRMVHCFDFEESRINPFPVPRHWRRAQGERAGADGSARPGFPMWNEAALDYRSAANGEGSVFLPAAGGSTCLRLEAGVLPVFAGADYMVSAKVRTRGLEHARARITARFLDSANRPIATSETPGALIADTPSWRPVHLHIPGDAANAAFLQIDLEVLQPAQYAAPTLGKHHVWREDFAAAAWFDDVTVTQLPRIELSTPGTANVLTGSTRPQIRAAVRDLTGEAMRGRMTLFDIDGRAVDSEERPIGVGQAEWSWTPAVERFGWYRATLEVLGGSTPVGEASLELVWLPEPRPGPRGRLGLLLSDAPANGAEAASLVRAAGAGAIEIPIWPDDLTAGTVSDWADALKGVLDAAMVDGTRATFVLDRVPRALAAETGVGQDDPLAIFGRESEKWEPFLAAFADRYGQSVRRWRVSAPRAQWNEPDGRRNLRTLRNFLAEFVPGPEMVVPWDADIGVDWSTVGRTGPEAVEAAIAPSVGPEAVRDLVRRWHDPEPPAELGLALGSAPGAETSRSALIAMTHQVLAAWAESDAAGVETVCSIRQPWTRTGGTRSRIVPAPELALWRCLGDRLGGLRFIGELPIAPGSRGMLFGDGSRGLLVAWRDEPGDGIIDAFLGDAELTAFDLFGNPTPVEGKTTRPANGPVAWRTHLVPVTESPVFVEGVDTGLSRFISSLRVEPAFASSAATQHELELILINPWSTPIAGSLVVVEPGGLSGDEQARNRTWRVSPRQASFSIAAGGEARIPITLGFGAMEEAGVKPFVVDVDLQTRPEYGRLRLRTTFEIGLPELRLDLTARVPAAGSDVVVEAVVQNNGPAPVTLELTAFAPPGAGFARSRATVSGLAPGESAVRRFPFARGAGRLRGQTILVGVQDTASGARLNRTVLVESGQISGVDVDAER